MKKGRQVEECHLSDYIIIIYMIGKCIVGILGVNIGAVLIGMNFAGDCEVNIALSFMFTIFSLFLIADTCFMSCKNYKDVRDLNGELTRLEFEYAFLVEEGRIKYNSKSSM